MKMTRRRRTPPRVDRDRRPVARREIVERGGPLAGMCARCDEPLGEADAMTKRHGQWIHKTCAPGSGDE